MGDCKCSEIAAERNHLHLRSYASFSIKWTHNAIVKLRDAFEWTHNLHARCFERARVISIVRFDDVHGV